MNPVDYSSRELSGSGKEQVHIWFYDPEFLWKLELPWPKEISRKETQDNNNPETKKAIS